MTPQIQCTDLVRIYSTGGVEVQALQGLTLTVEQGEVTAVVGASGSGKSTLLSILSSHDTPTAGSATVAGHDLLTMSSRERTRYRRHTVGFVWQQAERNLLGPLTVTENIATSLAIAGTARRARRARSRELLDVLGIGDLGDRRPAELSGGQQQRAAIAVALANEPAVLFADEPTGELDEANSEHVFGALREVNRALGTTVLIVTHDEGVSRQVRRTVQIRDGRLSTETHREQRVGEDGEEQTHAREYAVLDRVGRLQLPEDYLRALALKDLVRLQLERDHVEVHPTATEEKPE
ncbi:ABC-type lipoprotein export system ATPase subunit [Microbacterium sp. AK009]|uniref:ABC transporter ATP-binding protein n=1 Tax=Microbacterium sp. AK009 TaxID=2723068 RepID=UPI0015CAAD84|nr:ABC transporter ATP-binding protein [Microbacterium sp. AK009]NYF16675.1 ABC-type lipoprotein export system ATPase subunit [Microbacterium sp. AK009]